MDPSKIGNARQQADNAIAIDGARPLGDLTRELVELFKNALADWPYRNPQMVSDLRGMAGDLSDAANLDWLNASLALGDATSAIRDAIAEGDLKVWFVKDSKPVQLAACELDREDIRYGIFTSLNDPDLHHQGARLWIATKNWAAFLARLVNQSPGLKSKSILDPSTTFDSSEQAEIRPTWTVNETLAWIATRTPSWVAAVGRAERADEKVGRAQFVLAISNSRIEESGAAQAFMKARQDDWLEGNVLAHAGRALLEKILEREIEPMTLDNGRGRKLLREEFVGIGDDRKATDWLNLDPQPRFSSAEIIRAFPAHIGDAFTVAVASTTGAEKECRDWLAREFATDPNRRRSKAAFRDAALREFRGRLSQRGFNLRVWPAVAQAHGRDGPGAKKKS